MSRVATVYIASLVAVVAAAKLGYQPAEVTVGRLQWWVDLTTPGCFLAALCLTRRTG